MSPDTLRVGLKHSDTIPADLTAPEMAGTVA